MLELLTEAADIQRAQKELKRKLSEQLNEEGQYLLGYPGGSFYNPVRSSRRWRFWYSSFLSDEKDRWINLFGDSAQLAEGRSNSIVVECNPPVEGVYRRSAGVFLREPSSGVIFLGHRGRLAGGRPGIGKRAFQRWYKGNWQPFLDDERGGRRVGEAIVLSDISDGEALAERIQAFVEAAAAFKVDVVSGEVQSRDEDGEGDYSSEFSGSRTVPPQDAHIANCDHGRVVDALRDWLLSEHPKAKVSNKGNPDLVADLGQRRILVEVKTDASTTCVYTGIGQLAVYGLSVKPSERWLVLPVEGVDGWASVARSLGIRVLGYRRRGRAFEIVPE